MTAEIAVMNRHAVALAADSAVTTETSEGGRKAWQLANKPVRQPLTAWVRRARAVRGVCLP
jgi:hypothetical protein